MKTLAILYFGCFMLLLFTNRLTGHLKNKAKLENPFIGYDNITKFYCYEILYGIFLSATIEGIGWFISEKTENNNIKNLHKLINVLTFIGLVLLFIIVVVPLLHSDWF